MGIPISKWLPEIHMYMYNNHHHKYVHACILQSQLDESGEISIDKLTAYKTDLEYLDDHFQVRIYTCTLSWL